MSDRQIGLLILFLLGIAGIGFLLGFAFGLNAWLAVIIFGVAAIFYMAIVAVIYDTDPIVWTSDKISTWLDKYKGEDSEN